MDCYLFTCAESVVVDIETNRLSLFNLMEELGAASFPVVIFPIAFVAAFTRTPDEPDDPPLKLLIKIDDEVLFQVAPASPFRGHLRSRAIWRMASLVIPKPGVLRATLHTGELLLGKWEMTVQQVGEPQLQAQTVELPTATEQR